MYQINCADLHFDVCVFCVPVSTGVSPCTLSTICDCYIIKTGDLQTLIQLLHFFFKTDITLNMCHWVYHIERYFKSGGFHSDYIEIHRKRVHHITLTIYCTYLKYYFTIENIQKLHISGCISYSLQYLENLYDIYSCLIQFTNLSYSISTFSDHFTVKICHSV